MRLVVTSMIATVLVGCGGSGGPGTGANASTCTTPQSVSNSAGTRGGTLSSESAASESAAADPFETRGKVLLDAADRVWSEKLVGTKIDLNSPLEPFKSDATKSVLPTGTQLSVVMKDQCLAVGENGGKRLGEISSQLQTEGRLATRAGEQSYSWKLPRDMDLSEIKRLADADDCIRGVAAESIASTNAVPDDPNYGEQAHLTAINANAGYETFYDAVKGIKFSSTIAVIDTGIDMEHEDLRTRLWVNKDEIPGNGIDDDKNGYVDDVNGYNFASKIGSPNFEGTWKGYHHGTHVAGLSGAQAFNAKGGSGVMGWGAKIMMLNVFGKEGGAYSSDSANAIRYAVDNGAQVINMSIGGVGGSAAYESAIAYAINRGVVIVTAAGNENRQIGNSYFMSPGAYASRFAGMINIGSVDSLTLKSSSFSNWSTSYVELGAPGSEDSRKYRGVLSTMPGNKYSRISGTSMASPVAAGAAALAQSLIRSRGYQPTPASVEDALTASGTVLEQLKKRVKDGKFLNLKSLADYIDRTYPQRAIQGGDLTGEVQPSACP